MSKRWMAVKFALLAVTLMVAGLFWAVRERFQNRLVVENRSGQAVAEIRITVGGETTVFRDLLPGSEAGGTFRIECDDHFAVAGKLADGTKVVANVGYVTNGMSGQRASFVVHPGGRLEFHHISGLAY